MCRCQCRARARAECTVGISHSARVPVGQFGHGTSVAQAKSRFIVVQLDTTVDSTDPRGSVLFFIYKLGTVIN